MQTPKPRSASSEVVPRKVSPRASSSEVVPRKVSPRAISLEVPPKISPRGPQKDSPRVVRQLNKTPGQDSDSTTNRTVRTTKDNRPKITERKAPPSPLCEKQRPSKVVELESQISHLESDLEKVKNQLISSESWRKQAQQDAKELQEQLLVMSLELQQSRKQLSDQSTRVVKGQTIEAEETMDEIMKKKLDETLMLMDDLKNQLRDCKESEAHAQALFAKNLMELETAKTRVEMLVSDGVKSNEAYVAIASELKQSRTHVNSLEELVEKFKAADENGKRSQEDSNELQSFKSEVEQLRSALEAAEIRYNKEKTRSQRETELQMELKKSKTMIQELKADLMDKETELQGICEENEFLNMKLSGQREFDLEKKLEKSMADIEFLKANLMDKEAELQNITEENETLKIEEIKTGGKVCEVVSDEVEAAKVAEQEALMTMSENIDKSNKKVTRASEQLKAAEEANLELEAELRMLKVQANQWRKAAETAAAMLSSGNNMLNHHYNPDTENINLSYSDDVDEDDLVKRKNTNMLRKIGVFRKKSQK